MNTTACFVVAFSIRSFCVIILNYLVLLHHSHVSAKAPASKACSTVASGCADNHSFLSWLSVFFVITFMIITQFTRVIKSVRFKTLFFNTFCAHICCAVKTRPILTSSPRPFTAFSWSCHLIYVCHNYFLKESPVKGTAFVVAISLSTTLSPYL